MSRSRIAAMVASLALGTGVPTASVLAQSEASGGAALEGTSWRSTAFAVRDDAWALQVALGQAAAAAIPS